MSSITIQVDELTIKRMETFYEDNLIENKNSYAIFMAKSEQCTITAYKSKKVLFQGQNAENEASIWQTINQVKSKVKDEANHYYSSSIGSDEVGTGDYFGPVVVVATYVSEEAINELKKLNINDSKKLTDEVITSVAKELFKLLPYSLLIVNNEKYNEVMNEDMNLNKLKAILHKQAISNLLKKINKQPLIIIDQFCEVHHFNKYINDTTFTKPISFHTKAESKYCSVACASMMARYIFLQEMDKLSAKLDVTLQKGASGIVDKQAQELVNKYGKDILKSVAKLHFKNTSKINL